MGIPVAQFFAKLNPKRNLKVRLGLAFGVIALGLSSFLSLLVGYASTSQIRRETGHSLENLAYQMADKLDRGMFERYRDIQILSTLDTFRDRHHGLDAQRELLEKLQSTYTDYAWIGLADPDGKVLVSTGGILEGADVSQRPWFIEGRTSPFVGDVHDALLLAKLLPAPSSEPLRLVDVAVPVTDEQSQLRGVLGAHLSWSWAREVQHSLLDEMLKDNQVELLVLSGAGTVVLGPSELIDQQLLLDSTRRAESQSRGYVIETWPDGETYLTGFSRSEGYRTYPGLGWIVLVRQQTDVAFAPAQLLQEQILGLSVVLGIVCATAGWFMAGRFTRPIRVIAAAAERIGIGDRAVQIPVYEGEDEVAGLSGSLHKMVATLTTQEHELKALNEQLRVDIAERKLTEAALSASEERYRQMFEKNQAIKLLIDPASGSIVDANPAACAFYGYDRDSLRAKLISDINTAAAEHVAEEMQRVAAEQRTYFVFQHRLASGEIRDVEIHSSPINVQGQTLLYSIIHDITERKALEQQLLHQAFHDPLTELANRALFMDRLEHALARSARAGESVAVLFLDLDRFKVVNDSLGHATGDDLLRAVTERVLRCVRPGDTVARLGGDEFTILLEDIADVSAATHVAERILNEMQRPFTLRGYELFSSFSIGIALSMPTHAAPEDLLRDADFAMYRAKADGKARYAVFHDGLSSSALERLQLETDLRRALERAEFRVHYQPIVDLETGAIREVEALVRWEHPQRGLVSPAKFIPLAEETGLILPIGQWVLEEACRQVKVWQSQYPGDLPLTLSVNLSARQFQHPQLAADIGRALEVTGFSPAHLKLEITESVTMQDAELTIATLRKVKELGVQVAIDDFGTGYSSLAYLKRFPIDVLKIDRSFVGRLDQHAEDTAIVQAIVTLARTLNLRVTAEGIETGDQLARLRNLDCDFGQGYYFAKPLPSAGADALLATSQTVDIT